MAEETKIYLIKNSGEVVLLRFSNFNNDGVVAPQVFMHPAHSSGVAAILTEPTFDLLVKVLVAQLTSAGKKRIN